jgi:N-sulfoglucosamine sulfohydrolase
VSKPNVLLIVSEDHSQHLGCYGDRFARTPVLDQLAADGTRFANAHTTQAVCSPGRASIHTGLYPHQCGQIGLATHNYGLFGDLPNLPRLLKSAGYRTGMIGKLHINPEEDFPLDLWWNDREQISFQHRSAHRAAQEAEQFMAGGGPFFLTVNFPDAHLPLLPQYEGLPAKPQTGDEVETFDFVGIDSARLRQHTADYYNCMSRLDTSIGLILEALERQGQAQDTLVIFTTDHGAQFSRGKGSIYEGGLRIPLIVRWPGNVPGGQVRDELVSHIDVLSSVMEAVECHAPDTVAGASWWPLARGETVDWREHLFAEWTSAGPLLYFPQRSVRDARYKLIMNPLQDRPHPGGWGYAGPKQRWETGATREEIATASAQVQAAYETFDRSPPLEFYDLQEDPWEFVNLAEDPQHAGRRDQLEAVLRQWQLDTDDAIADPDVLQRLTAEHDEIRARHYGDNPFGINRDFAWDYLDYLAPPGISRAAS